METDMYMTLRVVYIKLSFFQISVGEYGKIKTVDLKPNGDDIPVTNDNRFVKNKSLFFLHFFSGLSL